MSRDIISARFTRPSDTTAYASGDLVANSTTAGSVAALALAGPGIYQVRRIRIQKSGTSTTNASFRVHLYGSSPTAANGDNGAWSTSKAADYFGSADVTVDKAFTDGAVGAATTEINCAVSGSIYALIEARGAYTPASAEKFTVAIETAD